MYIYIYKTTVLHISRRFKPKLFMGFIVTHYFPVCYTYTNICISMKISTINLDHKAHLPEVDFLREGKCRPAPVPDEPGGIVPSSLRPPRGCQSSRKAFSARELHAHADTVPWVLRIDRNLWKSHSYYSCACRRSYLRRRL